MSTLLSRFSCFTLAVASLQGQKRSAVSPVRSQLSHGTRRFGDEIFLKGGSSSMLLKTDCPASHMKKMELIINCGEGEKNLFNENPRSSQLKSCER